MSHATPSAPVESKVKAATIGSGVGGATAALAEWALARYVFTGPPDFGTVPGPVSAFLVIVVPAACAYAGGWLARHTPRDP